MSTKPVIAQPVRTVTSQVHAQTVASSPMPKVTVKRTGEIESPWFRCLLYGDIDTYKTTVAASFHPEASAIVLTRGEDQLLPIRKLDVPYAMVTNLADFERVALAPEKVFGSEWANSPERTLIFDDLTRAKDYALEANDSGGNNKLIYGGATRDIGSIFLSVFRQPQHIIGIALANEYENPITHKDELTPDLPPAMRRFLTADFSYVFYSDKVRGVLLTSSRREAWQGIDEKMRPVTVTRSTFARHKLPKECVGTILNQEEPMDLRAIWGKIQAAKGEGK